jgi:hypothetical protein
VLICAVAAGASAQTTASRTRREPPQTMMLTLSLSGAGAGDSEDVAPEVAALTGLHTDTDALLTYGRRLKRATLSANGRTVVRYDARSHELTPMRYQGGAEFAVSGSKRQFRATESVGYSPFFQFGFAPEASPSELDETSQAHADFANASLSAYASTTDVTFSQAISRRATLATSYNLRRTVFGDPDLDLTAQTIGAHLSYRLTRTLSLRTGYGYQTAGDGLAQEGAVRGHDLDLGLDFSRAISITRKTTLSFSSGSTTTTQGDQTAFRFIGDANLTRQIGHTWSARVGFKRDVQMLEGFGAPVLSNTLTTAFGGSLSRRVGFSSTISGSTGVVGLQSASDNAFWNWTGAAGLRFTLGRRSSLQTQYFYSGHQFDQSVRLAPGLASKQKRQGVRVGMTWQAPLLQ